MISSSVGIYVILQVNDGRQVVHVIKQVHDELWQRTQWVHAQLEHVLLEHAQLEHVQLEHVLSVHEIYTEHDEQWWLVHDEQPMDEDYQKIHANHVWFLSSLFHLQLHLLLTFQHSLSQWTQQTKLKGMQTIRK